jgi:hypothetical protein
MAAYITLQVCVVIIAGVPIPTAAAVWTKVCIPVLCNGVAEQARIKRCVCYT